MMASTTSHASGDLKLPAEIIYIIMENSDKETLSSWARTSQDFNPLATRLLWRSLFINLAHTERNDDKRILDEWYWNLDRLTILISDRAVGKPSTPSGSLVHELQLDLRTGFSFTNEQTFIDTLPRLLSRVPNLEHCIIEGAIYNMHLREVAKVRDLKSLEIRPGQYYKRAFVRNADSHGPFPWESRIIEFGILGPMAPLRTLKIGRLVKEEGVSLARTIRDLQLTHLEVSAADFSELDEDEESPSPLITFLEVVLNGAEEDGKGRFPSSLETLVLRDLFHAHVPMSQNLLTTLIDRSNLKNLAMATFSCSHVNSVREHLNLDSIHQLRLDTGKIAWLVTTGKGLSCESMRILTPEVMDYTIHEIGEKGTFWF